MAIHQYPGPGEGTQLGAIIPQTLALALFTPEAHRATARTKQHACRAVQQSMLIFVINEAKGARALAAFNRDYFPY